MPDDEFDAALGDAISGQIGPGSSSDDDDLGEQEELDTEPESQSENNNRDEGGSKSETEIDKQEAEATDDESADNQASTDEREPVNYPFYIDTELADELDTLYNRYDAKNKLEDGDGIQKHRDFLEPVMRTALDELDLDDVVPWEPDPSSE